MKWLTIVLVVLISSFAFADYATSGDNNFASETTDSSFYGTDGANMYSVSITPVTGYASDTVNNLPLELFYGYCGDNLCDSGETISTCPADCSQFCGNGVCNSVMGETCSTCGSDCGVCNTSGGGGTTSPDYNQIIEIPPVTEVTSDQILMVIPLSKNLAVDGKSEGKATYRIVNLAGKPIKVSISASDNVSPYISVDKTEFGLDTNKYYDLEVYSKKNARIDEFNKNGVIYFTGSVYDKEQKAQSQLNLYRDFGIFSIDNAVWGLVLAFFMIFAFWYASKRNKSKTQKKDQE